MKRLLFLCITVFFLACTQVRSQLATKPDSTQIHNTIMDFYNWYMKNHTRLNSFELYRGVKTNDAPPYKIDWKEAERYFAYIRSSVTQLGEEFIKNQRKFLKECDSAFKADTEGDVPYGFDYDWYTNSQEDIPYTVQELKDADKWMIRVKGNTAEVEVYNDSNDGNKSSAFMCYTMNKEKGKWTISHIGCRSPENEPPPRLQ